MGQNEQDYRPLQEKLQSRGQNFIALLRCPVTGATLSRQADDYLISDGDPNLRYDYSDGIIRLVDDAQREAFAKAAKERAQNWQNKGWQVPDTEAFRRLPQAPLPTWSATYWQDRAYAVAEMWRVLEEIRIDEERLPIGSMGVAADFSDSMGWLGYGLDVSGYNTLVLSQYDDAYGLGVYPPSRYARIQGSLSDPPLAPDSFDLLTFSFSLETLENPYRAIEKAVPLLKARGLFIILSTSQTITSSESTNLLEAAGLAVNRRRIGAMGNAVGRRLKNLVGHGPKLPPLIVARKP